LKRGSKPVLGGPNRKWVATDTSQRPIPTHSSIRFGLRRFNTQAEVDYVADKVIDIVKKLRELSPLYEMVKEGIDLTKIEWQAH